MDLVCQECGESNRAGTEFCLFCGAYLPWTEQGSATEPPPTANAGATTAVLQPASPPPVAMSETPRAGQQSAPTFVRQAPCPTCSHPNDSALYFCARCGHQLRPSPAGQRLPQVRRAEPSWWHRIGDPQDRQSRRAYRRSLPAIYRVRRVVLGVLVLCLIAAFGVVSRGHPVGWALSRMDDLRKSLEVVPLVRADVEPAGATVPPSTPGSLLDRTGQAWTTPWTATTATTSCGPAPGTGTIVLRLPEARRIRAVEIYAGLSDALPERPQQFRPKDIAVDFGGGDCRKLSLDDRYNLGSLLVDSSVARDTVRISVMSAYPSTGGRDLLSISEVALLSRPDRTA